MRAPRAETSFGTNIARDHTIDLWTAALAVCNDRISPAADERKREIEA
jgi:hypothetical protein